MRLRRVLVFFQCHEFACTFCFIVSGLYLLTKPLSSDSWVELRLRRVSSCSTKDPVFYELGCRKLRWTDHQVARAGLWIVCYSFPRGIVPNMYFPTEPYCAAFDEDTHPAPWLDDARFFCVLAPTLTALGLGGYTVSKYRGQFIVGRQISCVLLFLAGLSGLFGVLKMYLHMNKTFLIPDRRPRVVQLTHWPFYSVLSGSIFEMFVGFFGQMEANRLNTLYGLRKTV